eukprot:TRINITY_DN10220_c0_g4_i1.p1 TRINITY_DN10220_c0_g4~~TRINITY_DN10220_c0_g4_i1.p1  ORF type:complete len:323 (-),score=78.15 TRINITY_DN10220_c0_g4_i1:49-1017(-)
MRKDDEIFFECGHRMQDVEKKRQLLLSNVKHVFTNGMLICQRLLENGKVCRKRLTLKPLNRILGRKIKQYLDIIDEKWSHASCQGCGEVAQKLHHNKHGLCSSCASTFAGMKCPVIGCREKIERAKYEDAKESGNTEGGLKDDTTNKEESTTKKMEKKSEEEKKDDIGALIEHRENNVDRPDDDSDLTAEEMQNSSHAIILSENVTKKFLCARAHIMMICDSRERFTYCLECINETGKYEEICRLCKLKREEHDEENCLDELIYREKEGESICANCCQWFNGSNDKECFMCGHDKFIKEENGIEKLRKLFKERIIDYLQQKN